MKVRQQFRVANKLLTSFQFTSFMGCTYKSRHVLKWRQLE